MTIITIDADRTRDTVILSVQPSVMRVYEARAKELGQDVGEMLEGLLADWPAVLAPTKPPTAPQDDACPTCGGAVRVASKGSAHWYEPAHVDDVTPLIPPNSSRRVVVIDAGDFPSGSAF